MKFHITKTRLCIITVILISILLACDQPESPHPSTATIEGATAIPPTAIKTQEIKTSPIDTTNEDKKVTSNTMERMSILEDEDRIWIAEGDIPEMAADESIKNWVGEEVIFLSPAIEGLTLGDYASNPANNTCNTGWNKTPYDDYAGKTGIIVDAQPGKYEPEVVIELDSDAITVSLCSANGLGFLSEMDYAQSLVGREYWSRNKLELVSLCPIVEDIKKAYNSYTTKGMLEHAFDQYERVIPIGTKVVITKVEWGVASVGTVIRDFADLGERPIVLYFKIDGEKEYCTYTSKQYFLEVYHPEIRANYSGLERFSDDFYLNDPFEMYPEWSQEVRDLIKEGEIAVGMTLDMALVAAGGELNKYGLVVSSNKTGLILQTTKIPYKTFVVIDGTVVEFVK